MALSLFCLSFWLTFIYSVRYTERTPRPTNPILRPAYQGSNPVADIFALWALRTTVEHLPRVVKNPDDIEARKQMLCASKYSPLQLHALI
jgi:hydroxyacid-oxoacid transhydrogenase